MTSLRGACREKYAGAGDETTRRELRALFDVIGTPTWADVAAVQSKPWRHYLEVPPVLSAGLALAMLPANGSQGGT